jgi:hypothetical protein
MIGAEESSTDISEGSMKHGISKTAAAVLVGGILVGGAAAADAQVAPQGRITSQEQLRYSIQKAVAAEQSRGPVATGAVGGRCTDAAVDGSTTA